MWPGYVKISSPSFCREHGSVQLFDPLQFLEERLQDPQQRTAAARRGTGALAAAGQSDQGVSLSRETRGVEEDLQGLADASRR